VSIFTSSGSIDGEIKNISIGGALINCQRLPDLEQTFSLTIPIRRRETVPKKAVFPKPQSEIE
jgi:hypothetical protein